MAIHTRWRSPEGSASAEALQAMYAPPFDAIAEIDALGHRTLSRVSSDIKGRSIGDLVAVALLRRHVMLFVAIRHLFESSAIDQVKGLLRSQLETTLAIRYVMFGARPRFRLKPRSDSRARETRARFFYVAAERGGVYHKQALLDGRWGRQGFTPGGRKGLKREIRENLARLDKYFPAQQAAFGPLRCFHSTKLQYFDSKQWFSFGFRSGSVRSIRALAKRLGCLWEYEVLYGAFSGLTHPRGISHDVQSDAASKSLIVFQAAAGERWR